MTLTLGPAYWDAEVDSLVRLIDRGGWMPHEVSQIERVIRDRIEQVLAGVASPTAVLWTERIREVDERLRMRWDFKNGFTIDRWAQGCWQVVGVLGFNQIMYNLVDYLRERDMQRWPSPEAYLKHKREQALRRQIANWKLGNEKLEAVIDKMSDRQIKEFINVERAMQTGDTVTMHGETKRIYDRLAAAARKSPAPPTGRAINPGHQFKILTRKSGGKHRLA